VKQLRDKALGQRAYETRVKAPRKRHPSRLEARRRLKDGIYE